MICDYCRKTATVQVPDVGAWCSWHAFSVLGDWPHRRHTELETRNSRRWISRIRKAA